MRRRRRRAVGVHMDEHRHHSLPKLATVPQPAPRRVDQHATIEMATGAAQPPGSRTCPMAGWFSNLYRPLVSEEFGVNRRSYRSMKPKGP